MIAGVWFIQTRSHAKWQIHKKKSSNLNAFVHEDLSGIRIIQSFHAEGETRQTFRNLVKEHRQSFMDAVLYADAFGSVVDFCWGFGSVFSLVHRHCDPWCRQSHRWYINCLWYLYFYVLAADHEPQ